MEIMTKRSRVVPNCYAFLHTEIPNQNKVTSQNIPGGVPPPPPKRTVRSETEQQAEKQRTSGRGKSCRAESEPDQNLNLRQTSPCQQAFHCILCWMLDKYLFLIRTFSFCLHVYPGSCYFSAHVVWLFRPSLTVAERADHDLCDPPQDRWSWWLFGLLLCRPADRSSSAVL